MGKLNCLISDGTRLFCYRDAQSWKNLVYCHVYILGQDTHVFADPNVKLSLEGQSINRGIVVATQPLSGNGWHPLEPGELLVLEDGRLRYSSDDKSPVKSVSVQVS